MCPLRSPAHNHGYRTVDPLSEIMATPTKKDDICKHIDIADKSRDPGELLRVAAHTAKALSAHELAAILDKISRPATRKSVPLDGQTDNDQVL
jgi:hypothetical protein